MEANIVVGLFVVAVLALVAYSIYRGNREKPKG